MYLSSPTEKSVCDHGWPISVTVTSLDLVFFHWDGSGFTCPKIYPLFPMRLYRLFTLSLLSHRINWTGVSGVEKQVEGRTITFYPNVSWVKNGQVFAFLWWCPSTCCDLQQFPHRKIQFLHRLADVKLGRPTSSLTVPIHYGDILILSLVSTTGSVRSEEGIVVSTISLKWDKRSVVRERFKTQSHYPVLTSQPKQTFRVRV